MKPEVYFKCENYECEKYNEEKRISKIDTYFIEEYCKGMVSHLDGLLPK